MHSAIHITLANESTRARIESSGHPRRDATRGSLSGLRARLHRAAAAPVIPSRAAPGIEA